MDPKDVEHLKPAFPTLAVVGDTALSEGGVTMRDYFAAKALLGLIAEPLSETSESTCVHCTPNDDETTRNWAPGERLATAAYVLADAMLRARGQS